MTDEIKLIDHETALAELMKDPAFAREYRRQNPFTQLAIEIYRHRKACGLGQLDLADRIGVAYWLILAVESGDVRDIKLRKIIDIAEALGCRVEIAFKPIEETP